MKADFEGIKEDARRAGWSIVRTSGGRLRFTHPDVPFPVFTGVNPGEFRSLRNLESTLVRALRKDTDETEPVARPRKKKKTTNRISIKNHTVPKAPDHSPAQQSTAWSALGDIQERYARAGAWRLAVLRMRVIANRSWPDIILLRAKFKTDRTYRHQILMAWTNSTKFGVDDVPALRERLREKGRVSRAIERFRSSQSYRHHVFFGRPIRKPA